MGGRLLHSNKNSYDKMKDEVRRLAAIDSKSYKMVAQQAWGRAFRHKSGKSLVTWMGAGAGKTLIGTKSHRRRELENQKLAASSDTDNQFPQWDFIGELIIDTRSVDFDEEDYGINIVSSNAIPLVGGSRDELLYQESLHRVDIGSLLGLEQLDECEVDIGVFRYVFGCSHHVHGVDIFMTDDMTERVTRDSNSYELISRQKYEFGDEEYVTREDDECTSENEEAA